MSNDKKQHKKDASNDQAVQTEEQVVQVKGERGIVGTATPSQTIKAMWHKEHFSLKDNKKNGKRQEFVKGKGAPSLKRYARQLAASNQVVANWFANKAGAFNAERSEKNNARIALERQASASSRKGSSK